MQVELDDTIIQRMKQLFPDRIADSMKMDDVRFFADFMFGLGIDTVKAVLQTYPGLTFGDFITRYNRKR